MSNPFDTDDKIVADPEFNRREDPKQLKFLEILIDKAIKRLEDDSFEPKIQDALKAIQLKQKVAKTCEAEKIFWQEIETMRNEELPKRYPENFSLETQIQSAILRLKYEVKNGILPVKTITDTFNRDKSKESQLSYRRIGQLLSTMGFRKAKTPTGACAILWDDDLLYENSFSNNEKNEKQPSVSSVCSVSPASLLGENKEKQGVENPSLLFEFGSE